MTHKVVEATHEDPEKALTNVFTKNRAAIRRLVAARMDPNLRGRVDPSDIVQDTLVDACRRLDDYLANPSIPFLKWLYLLAEQNTLIAYRRHVTTKKRSIQREHQFGDSNASAVGDVHGDIASDHTGPFQKVANRERMVKLNHAISMLDLPSQKIVRMRFLEGRSLADISDETGLSVGAVAKRVMRSLSKLTRFAHGLGLGTWE